MEILVYSREVRESVPFQASSYYTPQSYDWNALMRLLSGLPVRLADRPLSEDRSKTVPNS